MKDESFWTTDKPATIEEAIALLRFGAVQNDRDDAERWRAFCNLWAASTELKVAQDEDGTWSIFQVEDVEGECFAKLIGETPNAAIDKARSASGSSKEMEELQALAGELRDTSKWRVSSAQRTILLNAADAVAALWWLKQADAIASRSTIGRAEERWNYCVANGFPKRARPSVTAMDSDAFLWNDTLYQSIEEAEAAIDAAVQSAIGERKHWNAPPASTTEPKS